MSESWGFETKQVHAGAVARSDHRRARRADLPDHQLRVPRHRARGGALRARGARQHLHPDHEPHPGRVRGPHGRARRRRRRAGHRERAGRAVRGARQPGRERRATSSRRRRSTAAPTTSSTTRSPSSGWRSASSTTPTTSTRGAAAIRPNTRAFYGETIGNPKGDVFDFEGVVGDRAREQHPARRSTTRSHRPTCAVRSSTAPTSWCTRPPSSSAATARRSAGSSSTAGSSTTRAADGSPTSPSPTRATTARSSRSCPSRCGPRSTS